MTRSFHANSTTKGTQSLQVRRTTHAKSGEIWNPGKNQNRVNDESTVLALF